MRTKLLLSRYSFNSYNLVFNLYSPFLVRAKTLPLLEYIDIISFCFSISTLSFIKPQIIFGEFCESFFIILFISGVILSVAIITLGSVQELLILISISILSPP